MHVSLSLNGCMMLLVSVFQISQNMHGEWKTFSPEKSVPRCFRSMIERNEHTFDQTEHIQAEQLKEIKSWVYQPSTFSWTEESTEGLYRQKNRKCIKWFQKCSVFRILHGLSIDVPWGSHHSIFITNCIYSVK